MEYKNATSHPSLAFEALDAQGGSFCVAVLRLTLTLGQDGKLEVASEQEPLVMVDEFYGGVGLSSVKQESDLAPYKPWCDVIITGDACAPGHKPMKQFEAGVRISRKGEMLLNKRLTITGPRYWQNRLTRGWKLTSPEPIQSLPLRYEYAFGGECRIEVQDPSARRIKSKFKLTPEQRVFHPAGPKEAPAAHSCAETNPLGRGYAANWYLKAKKLKRIPAPQVESPLDPVKKFGKSYMPQGVGVWGRSWEPRLALAGTLDEAFSQSERWLPEDFDFAYWNGSHPDMQVPWLKGDETLDLINIPVAGCPSDRIDSQGNRIVRLTLPGQRFVAHARCEDGQLFSRELHIDTLTLRAHENTLHLVYRLKLPLEPKLQRLEVMPLGIKDESRPETILEATHG